MSQNVYIRLASQRIDNTIVSTSEIPKLFTPGEIITCQSGFMRWVEGWHCFYTVFYYFFIISGCIALTVDWWMTRETKWLWN